MRGWMMMAVVMVAVVGSVIGVGGCSRGGSGADSGRVSLALNWKAEPEFGGIYEAVRIGAFGRRGIELQITGGPGAPVVPMVAAGTADFGIASADEVVMARARGVDVVAVFATYQTCPQGLMAHASRGFTKLADVFASPGTVAMEPGLPYAKFLEQKYGGAKVKVVPYNYSMAPFLSDPTLTQQCFVTSEPIAAKRLGADPRVFLVADSGYNPYTAVVITRGEVLRKNAERVRAVVEALREGWAGYLKNPGPADEVMGKLNKEMDAATFAAAAAAQKPLIETAGAAVGSMTEARWAELIEQLRKLELIEGKVEASACFGGVDGKRK